MEKVLGGHFLCPACGTYHGVRQCTNLFPVIHHLADDDILSIIARVQDGETWQDIIQWLHTSKKDWIDDALQACEEEDVICDNCGQKVGEHSLSGCYCPNIKDLTRVSWLTTQFKRKIIHKV